MGYRPEATHYKLVFEDRAGLEVTAKSVSTGRLLRLMRMAINISDKIQESNKDYTSEDLDSIESLFTAFDSCLVSWNIEDEEGKPVPANREGIESQEFDFIIEIIMAWIDTVAGVDKKLGKGSNSGLKFPEGSLPMAPLSPSLGSLMKQS